MKYSESPSFHCNVDVEVNCFWVNTLVESAQYKGHRYVYQTTQLECERYPIQALNKPSTCSSANSSCTNIVLHF